MAIVLIFLSISVAFSTGTNAPVSVAFFDLETRAGVSPEVSAYLSETLRTALFDTGAFALVERAQMERVIAGQKL
jgi:curli biogenesis system outer membrane secretion channel CsgG